MQNDRNSMRRTLTYAAFLTGLCLVLLALYIVVLALPGWRGFFELAAPDPAIIIVSLLGTALAVTGLVLTDERFLPAQLLRRPPGPPSGPAPA